MVSVKIVGIVTGLFTVIVNVVSFSLSEGIGVWNWMILIADEEVMDRSEDTTSLTEDMLLEEVVMKVGKLENIMNPIDRRFVDTKLEVIGCDDIANP